MGGLLEGFSFEKSTNITSISAATRKIIMIVKKHGRFLFELQISFCFGYDISVKGLTNRLIYSIWPVSSKSNQISTFYYFRVFLMYFW